MDTKNYGSWNMYHGIILGINLIRRERTSAPYATSVSLFLLGGAGTNNKQGCTPQKHDKLKIVGLEDYSSFWDAIF